MFKLQGNTINKDETGGNIGFPFGSFDVSELKGRMLLLWTKEMSRLLGTPSKSGSQEIAFFSLPCATPQQP